MEERVASPVSGIVVRQTQVDAGTHPAPSREIIASPPLPLPPPPGVYVVQVPKDQIYRVPPPENALIVERHRSPAVKNRSRCTCFLHVLLPIVLVLGLVMGIYAAASYIFVLRSESPKFQLTRFSATNSTKSHKPGTKFSLEMRAENPNDQTILTFQSGGETRLSYNHDKIAYGDTPELELGHEKSAAFRFSLDGAKYKLPSSTGDASRKGKIALTLSVNVPMRVRSGWVKSVASTLSILCDFKVDSLSKASKILTQECRLQG
uniref:Late embryogenesis abundant protein LEA-2 subgroup domain-containing protein n=1 Tax=Kalanchoe fedtschenkoi TaxID=63787 RepID=A0A7N0ULY1_KALFE